MTFGSVCYGCFRDTIVSPCPFCGYDPKTHPQPEGALPVGVVLCGRYTLGRVISMGEMGISYLGYDLSGEKTVLIKEYMPLGAAVRAVDAKSVGISPPEEKTRFLEGVEKFLKEARALRALRDVVCLSPSESDFIENNTVYAVYPYLDAPTLRQKVQQEGPCSYEEAMQLFVPVMRALGACHGRELLHLAVTPDNLLVTAPDRAVLVNFSSARFLSSMDQAHTLTSPFMPPELGTTPPHPGPWSDVYGAVASMYFALTGLAPGRNPLPLSEYGVELPVSVCDIIQHILTAPPKERPVDMIDLIASLSGRESRAIPKSTPESPSDEALPLWRNSTERMQASGRNREIFHIVPPPDKQAPRVMLTPEAQAAYQVGGDLEALNADVGLRPRARRWYDSNRDKLKIAAWMGILCAAVFLVIGVLSLIFPGLYGNPDDRLYVPGELTVYNHRWLGLELQVPSDFVIREEEQSVTLEAGGQAGIHIEFVAYCETPLFSREDFLRNREQVFGSYLPEQGVTRFEEVESGYSWDLGSTVVRVTGECVYENRPSMCTLYVQDTTNGFGCYFITVTHRIADPNFNAVQQAVMDCVSSMQITARVKTTLRLGESEDFGLRFLYDGGILDYEFSTSLAGAALKLYTKDGTFHSINIMPLTDVTDLDEYQRQQDDVIKSALGDRLHKSLSFAVHNLSNQWTGIEYRYDRSGVDFTTRQEMYGDVDGRYVNLYFYGDSVTHVALQQAALIIMQTMTFL